jgi:hypothetical protein
MPQLQNLVLTDRAGTPVNHTFVPREIDSNGVGAVVESTGVPIGDNRYSIGLRRTAEGRCKATVKMSLPIVQTQTINGISSPVVVRTAYVDCTFTFDSTSTEQERKDAVGMFQSSFDSAKVLVNDTIVKLQGVF